MGKRKEERERILDLIEARAVECDEGKQVYWFDAEAHAGMLELKRHATRLRALAEEIKRGTVVAPIEAE